MTLTEIIPFLESEESIERMLDHFFPNKTVERDLLAFMMQREISLESTIFLWNVREDDTVLGTYNVDYTFLLHFCDVIEFTQDGLKLGIPHVQIAERIVEYAIKDA